MSYIKSRKETGVKTTSLGLDDMLIKSLEVEDQI